MKKVFLLLGVIVLITSAAAQNVGIDVPDPNKKLSVNGSIVVDYNLTSNGGLDSAALLFGPGENVGITSNKNSGLIGYRGLDLWTNSTKRISINEQGNVGIGITGPQYKLNVGGEIVATDYIHAGNYLRAGSLPFSNTYRLQINSGNSFLGGKLFVGNTAPGSEQFYVSGPGAGGTSARFANGAVIVEDNFNANGNATVGGSFSANSLLAGTTLAVNGYAAIGGALDNNYRLRVYDGNARIGGDFHATGYAAIGGAVDSNFRLRVYDGNARVGGDAEVTGELTAGSVTTGSFNTNSFSTGSLTVDNTLTIGGKGSVRSNGTSPLRIGFDSKAVDIYVANNASVSVTANITDFAGSDDDARVMVSQVVSDIGNGVPWAEVIVTIMGVDHSTDTCLIWFTNKSGTNGVLKGTVYLTSIAKN